MMRLVLQKGLTQPQNLLFLLSSHLQAILYTNWVALACIASAIAKHVPLSVKTVPVLAGWEQESN